MTRKEGWRGTSEGTVRVCLPLVLFFFISVSGASAWTIGGRFGAELDGIGEDRSSYSVFDPAEIENPTITRAMTARALMELRTEGQTSGGVSFRLTDTARLARRRSRNSLLGETSWSHSDDRLRLEGQWNVQGGKDEPATGSSETITATWSRRSLPIGLNSRLRVGADWSQTSNPDLSGIFDYRILKGDVQVDRSIGGRFDVRALAGYRHKEADKPRTYDEKIGEIEANGEPRSGDRFDATVTIEDRDYRENGAVIPSFVLGTIAARYDLRLSDPVRPYLDQTLEAQSFHQNSGIFQDYQRWQVETGTDIFLNRLGHGVPDEGSMGLLSADWRVRVGATAEIFRASSVDADSASFLPAYDSIGGVVGIAREGGENLWLDLGFRAGRRIYRTHPEALHLVYEGLNLSLASSDYTYMSASVLLQWNPIHWLRADAFMQWDDEVHDLKQDNFRLWIANISLTHPF